MIQTTSTDSSKEPIVIYRYKHDLKSNMVERAREIIDESKIDYDMVAEDRCLIKYGGDGLPVRSWSYYEGRIISKTTLVYQK